MYTIWWVWTYVYTFETITTIKMIDIQLYIFILSSHCYLEFHKPRTEIINVLLDLALLPDFPISFGCTIIVPVAHIQHHKGFDSSSCN